MPDSLLTPSLSPAIDILVTSSTGHSAISTHFLGQQPPASPTSDRRELLEQLRELFGGALPAEEFYLLRALAYHLARLASHAETNKMTLSNLRLILSPTLRLSPVMLAILVEDREILFSKINDCALASLARLVMMLTAVLGDDSGPPSRSLAAAQRVPDALAGVDALAQAVDPALAALEPVDPALGAVADAPAQRLVAND